MGMSNQYQKYRTASVSTLTPDELLIFLYEELSLNINQAIVKLQ
jgi:flagellin-specific chaperone FliS